MTKVIANMSVSLDGFIADPTDGVGPLFDWHESGDVAVAAGESWLTFHTSEGSAEVLRESLANVKALVCGRRLFDLTGGWGGRHPWGVPVFVVTHHEQDGPPPAGAMYTFVTDGLESALEQAKAAAAGGWVGIAGAQLAQQCLNAGLLDEIHVDLVPVLLGEGIRWLANIKDGPVMLDDPTVIEGHRVTHLRYRVGR